MDLAGHNAYSYLEWEDTETKTETSAKLVLIAGVTFSMNVNAGDLSHLSRHYQRRECSPNVRRRFERGGWLSVVLIRWLWII